MSNTLDRSVAGQAPAAAITTSISIRRRSWRTIAFGFMADEDAFRVLNNQTDFLLKYGFIKQAVSFTPDSFYDRGEGK